MQDTEVSGRIDIIIFPSGGKEVIGRMPSKPETPESAYLSLITSFVAAHQNLEEPTKYTGIYSVKDGVVNMTWGEYAGEIENYEYNQTVDVTGTTDAMADDISSATIDVSD